MSHFSHGKPGLGKRWISIGLAALLTFPSGVALAGPADASAVPSVGALSVDSDPPGATVYVDGRFTGQTPVSVSRLPAGDHRVRVLKDGYLENGRIVSVNPKQANAVQVKLTRNTANVEVASQVTGGGGGGGGSKKWIWIGAAAGGGVLAAVLVAKRNKVPTVSGVTVNPTQGLAASTSISFSAQASDPDGDTLSYTWDFGDGSSGTNNKDQTHTYNGAGTFNVKVSVSDGRGASADASASVTIKNLTATWRGTLNGGGGALFNSTLVLSQSGANLTGSYSDQFAQDAGPLTSGNVSSSSPRVTFTVKPGAFVPFTFTGDVSSDVNTLTGTVNGSGFTNAPWTMSRQ